MEGCPNLLAVAYTHYVEVSASPLHVSDYCTYSAQVQLCEHSRKRAADAGHPSSCLEPAARHMSDVASAQNLANKYCKALRAAPANGHAVRTESPPPFVADVPFTELNAQAFLQSPRNVSMFESSNLKRQLHFAAPEPATVPPLKFPRQDQSCSTCVSGLGVDWPNASTAHATAWR